MNKSAFYAKVRLSPFGGRLTEGQVQGMERIVDKWLSKPFDKRWLAYMLATACHETAATMQAVRETLAPTDDEAIRILDNAFAKGRLPWVRTPYWRKDADGKSWLGRGLVQLTHKTNYAVMGDALDIDLVGRPELAMDPVVAVDIMFEGMTKGLTGKGDFTGKSLEDYFNSKASDSVNARRIINGTESAAKVSSLYRKFIVAIDGAL